MALNFNKIKGLFVVPEDEVEGTEKKQEVKKESEKKNTVENTTSFTTKTEQNLASTSPSKGEFNEQIFNSLTKATLLSPWVV